MNGVPWPEADQAFLRDNAATMTVYEIGAALGRKPDAVRSFGRNRGIVCKLGENRKGGHSGSWDDVRVTIAKKLWIEDGYSAAMIAKALGAGITRNAVIGKLFRLGLSGGSRAEGVQPVGFPRIAVRRTASAPRTYAPRAKPTKAQRPALRLATNTPKPDWYSPEPVAPSPILERPFDGVVVPLLKLGACQCRWPIGDPGSDGFGFCGKSTGATYCGEHARLAYAPQPKRRISRVSDLERLSRRVSR